jgi:hypothetical protein
MNTKAVIAVVGVVVILFGVLLAADPSLGLACTASSTGPPGGGGGGCSAGCEVVSYFTVSAVGENATFVDKSTVVENGVSVPSAVSHIGLLWGDGVAAAPATGSTLSHVYAKSGAYTVQETVSSTAACLTTGQTQATSAALLTINTSGPGTATTNYHLSPVFTVTQNAQSVTVLDGSFIQNVSAVKIVIGWGDGQNSTVSAPGGSVSHTYVPPVCQAPANGSIATCTQTYGVSERDTGTSPSGVALSVAVVSTVTISYTSAPLGCTYNSANGTYTPTGCHTVPSPPAPGRTVPSIVFVFNAVTGGIILAGFGILAFLLPVTNPVFRVLIFLGLIAVGAVTGYFNAGI